ncbi:MAG: hypothetical protein KAX46_03090 [Chromatiaceae bacterium]|nr:hypothetical protein [Chromatiaceae bacterium]
MSLPKPDLHIRISADCRALLSLLAEVEQVPMSTLAEHIVEEAILGRGHSLKLAARQMSRLGIAGSGRE